MFVKVCGLKTREAVDAAVAAGADALGFVFADSPRQITPEQAVEIQTLTGDSTDNIPGVPGIGPKKAVALIHKYGAVAGGRGAGRRA